MKDPVFYTKKGLLTKYALFCGYVEKKENKELYIEHNHIHVRKKDEHFHVWEVFEANQLTQARKFFNNL